MGGIIQNGIRHFLFSMAAPYDFPMLGVCPVLREKHLDAGMRGQFDESEKLVWSCSASQL